MHHHHLHHEHPDGQDLTNSVVHPSLEASGQLLMATASPRVWQTPPKFDRTSFLVALPE